MPSIASSPSRSPAIQTSWTLRRWAINSSRTAWRPSICSPPRFLTGFLAGFASPPAVAPVGCSDRPGATGAATLVRPWSGAPAGFVDRASTDRRLGRPDFADDVRAIHAVAAASAFSASAIWACRDLPGSWRVPVDHGDGPARDTFDAADGAEAFRPASLDRHRGADRVAEAPLHLVAAGCQLRSLAHHRHVDVADRPIPRHGRARSRGAAARSSRHPPIRDRCRGTACRDRRAPPHRAGLPPRHGRRHRRRCAR